MALCDVYEPAIARAAERHPKARRVRDFRKLYDHAGEFDAVVVSTSEHTHAFATLPALQLGKHVYCEKPLTHNIWEARVIREAAAKAKVATQMGTQIHAGDNYRRVVELIQTGAIGPVHDVHVWVGRAWGRQSEEDAKRNQDIVSVTRTARRAIASSRRARLGPLARPRTGPAVQRGLLARAQVVSLVGLRQRHHERPGQPLDRLAVLGSEAPIAEDHRSVRSAAPSRNRAGVNARDLRIRPARRACRRSSCTGIRAKTNQSPGSRRRSPSGTAASCSSAPKGCSWPTTASTCSCPRKISRLQVRPKPFIPKSLGHHAEWIHACKTGKPTTCNFEYSGWLTEANHLGNVAYRAGKKLEWDAAKLYATNAPEAERLIRREYRKGWSLS